MTIGPTPRIRIFDSDTIVLDVAPNDPTPQYREVLIGVPRADAIGCVIFTEDVAIAPSHIGCR